MHTFLVGSTSECAACEEDWLPVQMCFSWYLEAQKNSVIGNEGAGDPFHELLLIDWEDG